MEEQTSLPKLPQRPFTGLNLQQIDTKTMFYPLSLVRVFVSLYHCCPCPVGPLDRNNGVMSVVEL